MANIKIEFTQDYATKKKGDVMEVDSLLGSRLIHKRKVAKLSKTVKKSTKSSK